MYKLMIIDDDEPVRQWLKSNIDWEHLPVELVCEAADSDTAMEMYLLHRPKIVISDINIPIISGLDLAEQMKKEDPDLQFIIITGYDDFELVRRSVRLGAVDLLSKPIFSEAINASLRKIVAGFRVKQKKQSSVQFLQQLVNKNLPELQKSFMLKILSSPQEDELHLRSRFQQLNIPCRGPYFVVSMLSIQTKSENAEAQQQLLRDTLSDNLARRGFPCQIYIDTHSRLNCVISTDIEEPDDSLEEIITHTCEHMSFSANIQARAGIGPSVTKLMDLYHSRSGAMTALNYQCVLGSSSVMHFKNMVGMDTVFHNPETIHSYLLQAFRENDLPAISSAIKNQMNLLSGFGTDRQQAEQRFLFEYVQSITNEALRLGVEINRIEIYPQTIVRLMQDNPSDCLDDIMQLTEIILQNLNSRKTEGSIRIISKAKEYVADHIDDKTLCLETVSKRVNLSKIYFCKLFHQTEGVSFSVYLKQERINLAKHLLTTTKMRASEVSEAAGFSSPKYFGYVFKQTVGRTPVEYQRDHFL